MDQCVCVCATPLIVLPFTINAELKYNYSDLISCEKGNNNIYFFYVVFNFLMQHCKIIDTKSFFFASPHSHINIAASPPFKT